MSSIFSKFKAALVKSSSKISSSIDHIFIKKKLDSSTLEELEELLLTSDLGISITKQIIADFSKNKFDKEIDSLEIKSNLAEAIANKLQSCHKEFTIDHGKLNVVLICGVNGNGKTTTIGKLIAKYKTQGKKVAVAACDTFRAAAIQQLDTWAKESDVTIISSDNNSDPASVAYKAMQQCSEENVDILFIDTAGRLHNYANLMDELAKIIRVIQKIDATAPHHRILVLDAGLGQNAYNQVQEFSNIASINGLIITKLDGTAKAGVVVGLADKFNLPIYFLGLGESKSDLQEFDPTIFARCLVET